MESLHMRVGFAGLGRMGSAMARNLAKAGHDVTVWNRSADRVKAIVGNSGVSAAASPAELVERSEVVVTMLADDLASQQVHFGDDGLFSKTDAQVFLEMGTLSPSHVTALINQAPEGVRVIDAPVSGSTLAAEKGDLLIMAGCSDADAAKLASVLDAMGRLTIPLGRPGDGTIIKLAVNSMIHGINQSVSEALTLVEAAGINTATAFDVIEESAAAAPMLSYRRPLYLDEASNDVTFTVALARKDMEVTAALAEQLGVALPHGQVTLNKLSEAEQRGFANRDMAAILSFMRENNQ